MPKDSDIKIIKFATITCLLSSLALAGIHRSLEPMQARNAENDRKINVLMAFGVGDEKNKPTPEEIDQYFTENIREVFIDEQGNELTDITREEFERIEKETPEKAPLPLYIWSENGEDVKYGFPMKGMGLWSTVYSYMAIKKDLSTIKGVTFYGHAETPGLGGECSKPWFMNQFADKIVYENGKPVDFEVAKGKVSDKYSADAPQVEHAVDGISGATITAKGIESFINEYIRKYQPYFEKLKQS